MSRKSFANFAERMKQFRLSLDGESRSEVSLAAMDRCFSDQPGHRHHWRKFEQRSDAPDKNTLAYADFAIMRVVDRLALEDKEQAAQQACAFVRGKRATLPWSTPPEWEDSPNKRTGRPAGTRVVGNVRVLPPNERAAPEDFASAPAAHAHVPPQIGAEASLAVLERVAAGAIEPAAALEILKILTPCQHGAPTDQPQRTSSSFATSTLVQQLLASFCEMNRDFSAGDPAVPRELLEELLRIIRRWSCTAKAG
jgi:hypothetical protein